MPGFAQGGVTITEALSVAASPVISSRFDGKSRTQIASPFGPLTAQ
jgi:hypothetical protein